MPHSEYPHYISNHGYHPSKGTKPVFIAFGPDIKEGMILEEGNCLNCCPTFAKLLQVKMEGLEGIAYPIIKE